MAYQSLYRRYRSRRFGELRGQEHVVTALRNAVREGRVGHAYLFSGPRGTGKTSAARILAKVLNCTNVQDGEPCLECESCLAIEAGSSFDVHELDAASNRGIDDIRRLIESAAMVSGGRTKLYILDEVHMLTEAAENALLKTLEEPPDHVVFVLATTDPQKVRATIRSRTQPFDFHLLPMAELEALAREIIDDAQLDVGPVDAAVEYVLRAGGGSARDTLSALDQVVAARGVPERTVSLDELVDALVERDTGQALIAVNESVAAGRDPRVLGEQLVGRLRDVFLAAMKAPLDHLSDADRARVQALADRFDRPFITRSLEVLGDALAKMPEAPDKRILLETALVRLTDVESDTSVAALLERVERLERGVAGAPAPRPAENPSSGPRPADAARQALAEARAAAPAPPPTTDEQKPHGSVSSVLPSRETPAIGLPSRDELTLAWGDHVLGALPRTVKVRFQVGRFVSVENGKAQFALPNEPHRKRCEEMRSDVEHALAAHFSRPVPLQLIVDGGQPAPVQQESQPVEVIDVRDLEDAPADPRTGIDRLADAFPGSQLIEDDS